MNILLIGHKGMLGSELMKVLEASHAVVGKDIDDVRIERFEEVKDIIATLRPDCVVNAAAYANVEGCEINRDYSYDVNVRGVENIARACEESDARIVHFSTDYVFDGSKTTAYCEDDPCDPLSVYGTHKYESEQCLRERYPNALILRTAWLYGAGGKNFVRTILQKAEKERTLRVVDDQRGSPTYAADLARATALLVERGETGLYHVVNRGSCSWYDFAKEIISVASMEENVEVLPVSTKTMNLKARRPVFSVLSTKKFSETTGKTLRFWQLALREYIEQEQHRLRRTDNGGSR